MIITSGYLRPIISSMGSNTVGRTWFGTLSDYPLNYSSGYGLKYNNYKEGSFTCSGSKVKLGNYNNGLYSYIHYMSNNRLTGRDNSTTNAYTRWRNLAAIYKPTVAVYVADGIYRSSYVNTLINYFGYRHGGSDNRIGPSVIAGTTTGRANIVFVDGHVSSTTYQEFLISGSKYLPLDAGFYREQGVDMNP